jgi:hypothetical protein
MASAVSSADPVSACTTVASASPDMVVAAVVSALLVHSARNSRTANRSR